MPRIHPATETPSTGARLGITLGDPAGIGPEVAIKALALSLSHEGASPEDFEIFGRGEDVRSALSLLTKADRQAVKQIVVREARQASVSIPPGRDSAAGGEAAYQALRGGLDAIGSGLIRGIVTAPISKRALHLAGHLYPGHTELLAEAAGGVPVRMMLSNPELAVVLVTIHLPLRQALDLITTESIVETIRIAHRHFVSFEGKAPRIGVAGLNPHAGEGGLLGREEIDLIVPAIDIVRQDGILVEGPFAPDTIFMRARATREFDLVIAQYHDQGLIPVKYLGVEHGVNTTLGLPFIRTSPDHGTAFDLAGQNRADPTSMLEAIGQARRYLARGKRQ